MGKKKTSTLDTTEDIYLASHTFAEGMKEFDFHDVYYGYS